MPPRQTSVDFRPNLPLASKHLAKPLNPKPGKPKRQERLEPFIRIPHIIGRIRDQGLGCFRFRMLGFRGLGLRGWGFFDMLWCPKSMALEVLAGADPLLGVSTKPVVLRNPLLLCRARPKNTLNPKPQNFNSMSSPAP